MSTEGTISAFDLGTIFGYSAGIASKTDYSDIIKAAEVELDLMDVMLYYWENDVVLIRMIFPQQGVEDFKKGWEEAFYNTIFPLRHLV